MITVQDNSNHGVSGALAHRPLSVTVTIGAFTGIAWYNVIMLIIVLFFTFKRWKGLYFYSILLSSWGVLLHSVVYVIKLFSLWNSVTGYFVIGTFGTIGWYLMVTGQALVLYSRLHLVTVNHRKIRWVLYMIITNVFLLHIPTTVCTIGSNSDHPAKWITAYSVMERIQVTGFCIQEFIISGLYIYHTRKMLKPASNTFRTTQVRRIMNHLIYINIVIILMDVTLLITQYTGFFELQTTYKGMLYSVKLTLEFSILNQLKNLNRGDTSSGVSKDSSLTRSQSRLNREIMMSNKTSATTTDDSIDLEMQQISSDSAGKSPCTGISKETHEDTSLGTKSGWRTRDKFRWGSDATPANATPAFGGIRKKQDVTVMSETASTEIILKDKVLEKHH